MSCRRVLGCRLLGGAVLSYALLGCTLLGCKAGRPWMGNPFASASNKLVLPDPPTHWAADAGDGPMDSDDTSPRNGNLPGNPENVRLAATRSSGEPSGPVLVIDGVRPGAGTVRIAVFEASEGFPDRSRASRRYEIQPSDKQFQFPLSPDSRTPVAIAVFQDLDDNGDLNRGAFGIPQEPYGFSGKPSSSMGPPSFAEASVSLNSAQSSRIHVQLN